MIRLSNDVKPASRKEAAAILADMMLRCNEIDGIGNDSIERLYRYFLPAAPKVAKTPEQWVGKAIDKKDRRPQLAYLHGLNGSLYATDGRRMHWIPSPLEGFHDPRSVAPVADVGHIYPDVLRIIPSYREEDFVTYTTADLIRSISDQIEVARVGVNCYNFKFILDAINSAPTFDAQQPGGDGAALLVRSRFGLAIVMGIARV